MDCVVDDVAETALEFFLLIGFDSTEWFIYKMDKLLKNIIVVDH